MSSQPYPLYLERHLSPRLWGDGSLEEYLGLAPSSQGEPIGESWEVWAGNTILNGPLAGAALQRATDLWDRRLLGSAAPALPVFRFPLLAKFIGAGQDLSLQVHPDDSFAREHHSGSGHSGKAEAWLILQAEPGAFIYRGFSETVTEAQVRAAAADGSLAGLLNRVPVRPGDVIYNPPGMVHAIGAGIILYEIQQSSDLTYRLYDYGRRDSHGKLRKLHLDAGLAVADLSGGENALVERRMLSPHETELVATDHFKLTEVKPATGSRLSVTTASVELLTAVDGTVTLESAERQLELPAGTSLVLPAVAETYLVKGSGRLLRTRLPDAD